MDFFRLHYSRYALLGCSEPVASHQLCIPRDYERVYYIGFNLASWETLLHDHYYTYFFMSAYVEKVTTRAIYCAIPLHFTSFEQFFSFFVLTHTLKWRIF